MAPRPSRRDVTRTLARIGAGDSGAVDELLVAVYRELRALARARMAREPAGHTLQPTALVHEAYLRLVAGGDAEFANRAHFFAAAARAMQRILVERARRHAAKKRGGDRRRVTLDSDRMGFSDQDSEEILSLDRALRRLAERDAEMADVVRLRFFAGMTVAETAELLGATRRTVERRWTAARAWLLRELESSGVAS